MIPEACSMIFDSSKVSVSYVLSVIEFFKLTERCNLQS